MKQKHWDAEQEFSRHHLSGSCLIQTRVHHMHRSVLSFILCFSAHLWLTHQPLVQPFPSFQGADSSMRHSQPRQPLPWVHTNCSLVRLPRGRWSDLPEKKKWASFYHPEKCDCSLLMKRYQILTLVCHFKYLCSAHNSQQFDIAKNMQIQEKPLNVSEAIWQTPGKLLKGLLLHTIKILIRNREKIRANEQTQVQLKGHL